MALWLIRAGKGGEYEARFLEGGQIIATWNGLKVDLGKLQNVAALREELQRFNPDEGSKAIINWASQLWPFAHVMKPGDLVVLPRKTRPSIAVGKIVGEYQYHPSAANPYYHTRAVEWLNTDVPRTAFSQDLLYSFGAFLTICRVERNDAEQRVRAMADNGWKPETISAITARTVAAADATATDASAGGADLEPLGRDQIAKLIGRRYKGHDLTRLVEGILRAQGYQTFRSPPGADKGVDLLAAAGPLGFSEPMICVQVKSEDGPVDSPTLNQLIGAMQNVGATNGLMVGWGGFRSSVTREIPSQFFKVRLWDRNTLIDQLLAHYDQLHLELKAELPLKRVWTIAPEEPDAVP